MNAARFIIVTSPSLSVRRWVKTADTLRERFPNAQTWLAGDGE